MKKISNKLQFLMLVFKTAAIAGRKFSGQGLGFGDLAVLYTISQSPEGKIRPTDLAEAAGLTASGVTRMLLPLEKIGVVKRQANEHDSRSSFVTITKSGQELFENALEYVEMRCDDFIPNDQSKKINQLNTLLKDIAK